jgi:hypothetical protein
MFASPNARPLASFLPIERGFAPRAMGASGVARRVRIFVAIADAAPHARIGAATSRALPE